MFMEASFANIFRACIVIYMYQQFVDASYSACITSQEKLSIPYQYTTAWLPVLQLYRITYEEFLFVRRNTPISPYWQSNKRNLQSDAIDKAH